MAPPATTADVPAHREIARAKINLALHVLGRRSDGYHELDSIVAFADIGDHLAFAEAGRFEIEASGPFACQLPSPGENIVYRAWKAVNAMARGIKPVQVTIEKNLPVSAGIGGGSANAAATVRALLAMNGLRPTAAELNDLALSLGADVPVCIGSISARMRGIGELIDPLPNFPVLQAVLVNPNVAVPTPQIFGALGLAKGASFGSPVTGTNIALWRNDMTSAAVSLAPAIADVLQALNGQSNLITARMSGSGATCFGIFESAKAAETAAQRLARPGWWCAVTRLQ